MVNANALNDREGVTNKCKILCLCLCFYVSVENQALPYSGANLSTYNYLIWRLGKFMVHVCHPLAHPGTLNWTFFNMKAIMQ